MTDINVGSDVNLTASFAIDEVQHITSTGTSGVIRIRHGAGRTWTRDIPHDATHQDIAAALNALPEISRGGVLCWGGPLDTAPVTVEFSGAKTQKRSQPDLIVDATDLSGGTVTISTSQPGGPVALDTAPTITITDPNGTTTTPGVIPLDDQGTYRCTYRPAVSGVHELVGEGEATVDGQVRRARTPPDTTFTAQ